MGRKGLSVIVALIVVIIIAVIIFEFVGTRPDQRGGNPYELDIKEYSKVDPALVHYKETKNIPLEGLQPEGMDMLGDLIFLTGERFLTVITTSGVRIFLIETEGKGRSVKATGNHIFVGTNDHIQRYSFAGVLEKEWKGEGDKCVFTSLAVKDQTLYVADAGNRRVLRYDLEGNLLGEFRGKSESDAGHGFIVPSACFDLVVNSYGELWVVNPGKHAIENYTDEGILRGFWQPGSMGVEGFSGCCNPAEMAVMDDGSFVTSEKGLVRIKVYDSSGKLKSVVAPPEKFEEEGRAPEVAVALGGVICALDFDRKVIRFFEKIAE